MAYHKDTANLEKMLLKFLSEPGSHAFHASMAMP